MLQSAFAFPPINLSRSDRTAKQSPGLPNGFFEFSGIHTVRSAGGASQSRDDFLIQAAMMFLGAFF